MPKLRNENYFDERIVHFNPILCDLISDLSIIDFNVTSSTDISEVTCEICLAKYKAEEHAHHSV